jgi:hypothetical protein
LSFFLNPLLSKSSVAGIADQILEQLVAAIAESNNDHTNNIECWQAE